MYTEFFGGRGLFSFCFFFLTNQHFVFFLFFFINKTSKQNKKIIKKKEHLQNRSPSAIAPADRVTSSCTVQSKKKQKNPQNKSTKKQTNKQKRTYISALFTGTAIVKAQRSTSRFFFPPLFPLSCTK